MSQQYDNTNRFVLFKNERKESDTHPDLKGSININGVEHWFDGWAKVEGGKLVRINGKIGKPKEARQEPAKPAPQAEMADDDIPF